MHPIERLRMVARAGGEEPTLLAREAAAALASFGGEPAALVTACRRLVDRQPACAPVWWVAARVLVAADPAAEAWRSADELGRDTTPQALAAALPEDATVVVLGWPEQVAEALARRGDVHALVVDAGGEAFGLAASLRGCGGEADAVPESGLAAAVAESTLVVLEGMALGPGGLLAVSGSGAAAAVGCLSGVPVWAVAGVGRVLPAPLWAAMAERLGHDAPAGAARSRRQAAAAAAAAAPAAARPRPAPWHRQEEIVPLAWLDQAVGPTGLTPVDDAVRRPTCPPASELVRGFLR